MKRLKKRKKKTSQGRPKKTFKFPNSKARRRIADPDQYRTKNIRRKEKKKKRLFKKGPKAKKKRFKKIRLIKSNEFIQTTNLNYKGNHATRQKNKIRRIRKFIRRKIKGGEQAKPSKITKWLSVGKKPKLGRVKRKEIRRRIKIIWAKYQFN